MINTYDILETIRMIQDECLDIRTTTMGISLLDCADTNIDKACAKVYDKICTKAEKLVQTGGKRVIPIIAHKITIGKSKQGNTRTPNSGCRVSFHSILCQPSF